MIADWQRVVNGEPQRSAQDDSVRRRFVAAAEGPGPVIHCPREPELATAFPKLLYTSTSSAKQASSMMILYRSEASRPSSWWKVLSASS